MFVCGNWSGARESNPSLCLGRAGQSSDYERRKGNVVPRCGSAPQSPVFQTGASTRLASSALVAAGRVEIISAMNVRRLEVLMATLKARRAGGVVMALRQREEAIARYMAAPNLCKNCNGTILPSSGRKITHIRRKLFCSSRCSAAFNNQGRSRETIEKQARTLRAAFSSGRITPHRPPKTDRAPLPTMTCVQCGAQFTAPAKGNLRKTCSLACLGVSRKLSGIKSSQTRCIRSRDEIRLFELCSELWRSVRHNESLVDGWDADIIVDDIKVAVLWNGPWHYRKLFASHSLDQVQTRDRHKRAALEAAGWRVMVFEDRHYTPDSAFEAVVAEGGIEPP